MGNRAHVIFKNGSTISPAVYLHWNGGPDSVYAALEEMERRGVRNDAHYQCARFIGLFHELFMPSMLSLGVENGPKEITPEALQRYDHGDNGVYVIESNGNGVKVRRFRTKEYDGPLVEWRDELVTVEKKQALKQTVGGAEVWLVNFPESNKQDVLYGA